MKPKLSQGFYIEQSINSETWITLDFVQGHGTSYDLQSYTYVDKSLSDGHNYYRLKQIDFDSKYEYSHIASVLVNQKDEIKLFPNPAKSNLQINGITSGNYIVTDLMGNHFLKGEINQDNQQLDISNLVSGFYVINIYSEDIIIAKRFVKKSSK